MAVKIMEEKKKILVVDGDKHTRDCIEAMLEIWYSIVTAANTDDAFETYKKEHPDYVFAEFSIEPVNAGDLVEKIRIYEKSAGRRTMIFISTDGSANLSGLDIDGTFNKSIDMDTMINKLTEIDSQ